MLNEPTFPPLIKGIRTDVSAKPFEVACMAAGREQAEAGDFYWSPSETRLSLALVLEPDLPPGPALDILFVAMVAFGDSVGALAPPEVGITYQYPRFLLANGARVGSVSVRQSPEIGQDGAPEWMVVGLQAEISPPDGMPEPGLYIDRTSLWDEGCGELNRTDLLESFVRHLKTWIHRWESDGARPVREAWLARFSRSGETVTYDSGGKLRTGAFLGLDEAGNMLVKTVDETSVVDLAGLLKSEISPTETRS